MSNRRSPSPGPANSPTTERPVSSSSSISYSSDSDMTYESSCLQPTKGEEIVKHSAPISKAMPLVGCPRCLMYVMLSEQDPKCPMCKSTSFLDFLADEKFMKTDNSGVKIVQTQMSLS